MILVVGATGNTGSEVLKQLIARGAPVRALVRSAEKAHALERSELKVVMGDLDKPRTLDAALEGVDSVYLVSSPDPTSKVLREVEVQGNLIDAARRAKVQHIVRVSALGADASSPVSPLRWHGEAEARLERSDIPFTHIRPNYFMQNLFMSLPSIGQGGVLALPISATAKISQVDVHDVAAVAVAALTSGDHKGRTLVVTGPEALSFGDIAERLAVATSRPVRFLSAPPEAAKEGMLSMGMAEWVADGMLKLYAFFDRGGGASVTSAVKNATGQDARGIDGFLQSFSRAMQATAS